ncbi:MAG: hypothetical protein KA297_09955 [Kofleriaceae bacterium]|jgi:hypothetical protein|nr:hypothetical protein [Kofleriaceae bacterium]MBP6841494.1 hypothetical protein [Kofleriaceae bacterium]
MATRQGGKRRDLDAELAALRALDPTGPGAEVTLRAALRSKVGLEVGVAAGIVAAAGLAALVDELVPAFTRLLAAGSKGDPGCRGKIAIVHALHALGRWADEVFVAGLHHVQVEGYSPEDTAAELRGLCGLAHAQHGRDDAPIVLAHLLADPERVTRVAAARGVADAGREGGVPLLHFKLLTGDDHAEVLAACAEALLHLTPDGAATFLQGLLSEHDERSEVVALALGGARVVGAVDTLQAWCVGASPEQRHRVGYLALALTRAEPALGYLLDAVASHGEASALAATRALVTFRDDPGLLARLRAAITEQPAPLRRRLGELL